MENMNFKVEGRKLIIEIDLDTTVRTTGNGNGMVACTNNWEAIECEGLEEKDNLTFYAGLVRKDKPRSAGRGRGFRGQGGRF